MLFLVFRSEISAWDVFVSASYSDPKDPRQLIYNQLHSFLFLFFVENCQEKWSTRFHSMQELTLITPVPSWPVREIRVASSVLGWGLTQASNYRVFIYRTWFFFCCLLGLHYLSKHYSRSYWEKEIICLRHGMQKIKYLSCVNIV